MRRLEPVPWLEICKTFSESSKIFKFKMDKSMAFVKLVKRSKLGKKFNSDQIGRNG